MVEKLIFGHISLYHAAWTFCGRKQLKYVNLNAKVYKYINHETKE